MVRVRLHLPYLHLLAAAAVLVAAHAAAGGGYQLPPLPYPYDALEPTISRRTLEIHHDRHHAKYVNVMNGMLEGGELEGQPLEAIVRAAHEADNVGLFNNAAQSWNHAFYWKCMTNDGGGGEPPAGSRLAKMIASSFGSYADFRAKFAEAGNTAFGSGWAWLVYDGSSGTGRLLVAKTIGAGNPIVNPGHVPILTMDVWEHAYYLDYQNARPAYVDAFLDKLVNWQYVSDNFDRAMATGRGAEL